GASALARDAVDHGLWAGDRRLRQLRARPIEVAMIEERPQAPAHVLRTPAIEDGELIRGKHAMFCHMREDVYVPLRQHDRPRRFGAIETLGAFWCGDIHQHTPTVYRSHGRVHVASIPWLRVLRAGHPCQGVLSPEATALPP